MILDPPGAWPFDPDRVQGTQNAPPHGATGHPCPDRRAPDGR